jgi:hypothetical protein
VTPQSSRKNAIQPAQGKSQLQLPRPKQEKQEGLLGFAVGHG